MPKIVEKKQPERYKPVSGYDPGHDLREVGIDCLLAEMARRGWECTRRLVKTVAPVKKPTKK